LLGVVAVLGLSGDCAEPFVVCFGRNPSRLFARPTSGLLGRQLGCGFRLALRLLLRRMAGGRFRFGAPLFFGLLFGLATPLIIPGNLERSHPGGVFGLGQPRPRGYLACYRPAGSCGIRRSQEGSPLF
jgi:hypothetical protein